MEARKLLFILVLVEIPFLLIYCYYDSIFYPAYLSTKSDCNVISESELNNLGYYTVGYFGSNSSGETITYTQPNPDRETIRHEQCHAWENSHRLLFSCNHPILLYLDELSCYIYEKF